MKKLARIFGFGEERRAAEAERSRRKRSVGEGSGKPTSKAFTRMPLSKSDAGVGMGGATQKFDRKMPDRATAEDRSAQPSSAYLRTRITDVGVPTPTESGVFVTGPRADVMALDVPASVDTRVVERVTLIVYGWENVQPGTLSWVFPSLRSALNAVRTMRNAVRWAVLHGVVRDGNEARDIDSAREHGLVLVEAS